ncbi:MAG: tetratricopeptide repeat protein [Planctomycetia bacterium]|nr:tetratricopeptide repeat protein [Planctomycetia bacterium]
MSVWSSRRQMNYKRAALLLAVLAAVGGAGYAANQRQVRRNADRMLELARAARDDLNRGDALQLYESYLNFQPRDVDAIAEYAAMLESDTNPKARRSLLDGYERLLRVAPHRAEERKKLVDLYLTYQVFTSAKHHLAPLLDPVTGTPDDPDLLKQLATCEFRLGRSSDGVAILKRLIATGRAGPEVYQKLADVYRKENTTTALEEAEKVMAQLAKDRANDTGARVVRIHHLYQSGRVDEARAEIAAAAKEVRDAEKSPEFSLLLADHYARDRLFDAARDALARAIGENPKDARLRTAYYQTLDQLRDKAKADEQLRKAVELAKNNDPGTLDLIDLMIDNRELDLAKREIERRYKGKETFRPTHDYLVGRVLLVEGDWPAARASLTRCLEFFEKHPAHYAKAQVGLAQCQTLANNPERALEAYTRAVAANPRMNAAQLGRAETLLRLNRLKDAEPILREYADAMPAARLALANAKFAEMLTRPVNRRKWTEVESAFGKPPFPVGIEVLKAKLLAAQGKPDEGEAHLKKLVARAGDAPAVHVAIAEFAARRSPKEAADAIAAGEAAIGDTVPFRLAKAGLAGRARDAAAVSALATDAGKFPADERHQLLLGLANWLYALKQVEEAAKLANQVAVDRPHDLNSRMLLAQIYLQAGQHAKLDPVIADLKRLDGEGGPLFLYASTMGELARTPKPDAATAKRLAEQLDAVVRKREVWTRPHALLGELALRVNDPDSALKHFRKAFELGERDEATFRRLLELLLNRGRTDEAYRILDDRDKIAGLPPDLFQTHALLEAANGKGGERSREIVRKTADSTDAQVQLFRGRWLALNGDRAAAIQALEAAVKLGPQLADAWIALVRVQASGDPAAARATAAKAAAALAAGQSPARSAHAVGTCHELAGDAAAAERAYLAGLQATPNDVPVLVSLADLYRRAGRHADADVRCRTILAAEADDDARRWARRGLALGIASAPNSHARLDEALAALDPNFQPVEHPEDLRLKAFLMARDPFRRLDAHAILERSAARDPLSPDEAAQRATLFLQEGRLQPAESDLREATKSPTCRPAHLILLHQVQLRAKRFDAAKPTLERILATMPGSWDATAEQARAAAARGDKDRAASLVKAFPNADKPDMQLLATGPLLAELGCDAEAEAAFRAAAGASKLPQRHAALAMFLIERGRTLDAMKTAWALAPADLPPNLPKATLLKNAIAARPRAAIAPADLAEWDLLVGEIAKRIEAERKSNPKDVSLILATAAILDAQARTEDAIAAYESALALDANNLLALNNLSSLLSLHAPEKAARALELANRALAATGPRGHVLDTRAIAHLAAGRPAEAMKDLAAARLTDPRAVYDFHAALAADKLHETDRRRQFLESAKTKGLKRTQLHPLEWPQYERMYGPE